MRFRQVTDWLVSAAARMVICAVQTCSLESLDRMCWLVAKVLADWIPVRRRTIDENLHLLLGEKPTREYAKMRRLMWHHLLLMICEIAIAPRKIHRWNWRDFFYFRDKNSAFRILVDSRPTILVTGHFGNFELAGYVTGLFGFPSTTIARQLDNPYLHKYLSEFRSLGGQHLLDKGRAAGAVQELLDRGGTVAMLADQHAGDKGCWVDFLGRQASCHKGLALLALTSKAPMVVCYCRRQGRPLQFEMGVTGIADPNTVESQLESVQGLTTWYNRRLEEAIYMAPSQYWWLHRRWRDRPKSKKNVVDSAPQ